MDLLRSDDGQIELEVVRHDGRPIVCHPIDVGELLRKQGRAIEVGDGVRVQLDEYSSEDDTSLFSSDDDEEDNRGGGNTTESDKSRGVVCGEAASLSPEFRTLTKYGDALDTVQGLGAADAEQLSSSPAEQHERAAQRYGRDGGDVALRSRRDVWAFFAPPADRDRNYKWLQSAPLMPSVASRRFRLPPLMYHAAACYLDPTDQGQRVFVYGGMTNIGKTIENEMYEFSLLTGSWWRVEGKQVVSPGNYAHAMVVVESLQRLVVIGGMGLGGHVVQKETLSDDFHRSRYRLLFPCRGNTRAKQPHSLAGEVALLDRPTFWSLGMRAEKGGEPAVGFMSMLFDMHLKTHRWRAIQTVSELPVSFHTAVVSANHIYVFGGVTKQLLVSSQLIGINAETYAISLIRPPSGAAPKARYLHSAVVYGNWMIVYGGFNVHNEPLDDVWAFDMLNERWEKLECQGAPARGAHCACIVGSRLIVVGGFEGAMNTAQIPTSSIFELQLVPEVSGKYIWRELVVRAPLPPLAFSVACHCADDASFIVYGGCTIAGKKERQGRKNAKKKTGGVLGSDENNARVNKGGDVGAYSDDNSFWRRLTLFNDGFVCTFPLKTKKNRSTSSDGAVSHVNELGLPLDPDALTPEFEKFVQRQRDFILKKHVSLAQTMKKTTLEELEGMETRLFLTSEEIELLLSKINLLCESSTEHNMETTLPLNVPDRKERLHLHEECVSLSRQLRDVILSMKGHEPGVTATRSKTHRGKTGQKLVDYSAAKPFRRALVVTLAKEIKKQLQRLHVLNKALETAECPGKKECIDVAKSMHKSLKGFLQTMKTVLEKYIEQRINLLVSDVERRKEHMRQLKEAVEKSRDEKPLLKGTLDWQQGRVKRFWKEGEAQSTVGDDKVSSRSASCRYPRYRSRSIGAGYYKDETQAVIFLRPKELEELLKKAQSVQKVAAAFGAYCRETMSSVDNQTGDVIQPQLVAPPSPVVPANLSLVVPQPVPPSTVFPTTSTLTDAGAVSPGEVATRHSDAIRQLAIEQAYRVCESMSAFAREFENRPVAEEALNPLNWDNEGESRRTPLRLSCLRPFLKCRARLQELQKKIPEIRVNVRTTDSSTVAPQDEKAQKHFEKLFKGLTALVQYFTMSFLSNAGARPPRSLQRRSYSCTGTPSVSSLSISRSSHFTSEPRLSLSKRHARKLISTPSSNGPVVRMPEESNDSTTRLQAHQQQQQLQGKHEQESVITFTPLFSSLMPTDMSSFTACDAMSAIPKPISLTSGEAKALVPPFPASDLSHNGDVIVASSRDTQVIPNIQSCSTPCVGDNYDPLSAATMERPFAAVAREEPTPPPRIVLSQGPQTTAARRASRSPCFRELSSSAHQRSSQELDRDASGGMVSLAPGSFQAHNLFCATVDAETSNMPRSCAEDLEEDYFLFGRRHAFEPATALNLAAGGAKQSIVAAGSTVGSDACGVTLSPPVGMPGDVVVTLPRKQTPRSLSRHRRSCRLVSDEPVEVAVGPVRNRMFRGRLTPGEALILRARERLRVSSWQQ